MLVPKGGLGLTSSTGKVCTGWAGGGKSSFGTSARREVTLGKGILAEKGNKTGEFRREEKSLSGRDEGCCRWGLTLEGAKKRKEGGYVGGMAN